MAGGQTAARGPSDAWTSAGRTATRMSSNNHPVEDSLLENGDLDGVLLSGLDLIPQAVWVTDTHGRIRWVNRASVRSFMPPGPGCRQGSPRSL